MKSINVLLRVPIFVKSNSKAFMIIYFSRFSPRPATDRRRPTTTKPWESTARCSIYPLFPSLLLLFATARPTLDPPPFSLANYPQLITARFLLPPFSLRQEDEIPFSSFACSSDFFYPFASSGSLFPFLFRGKKGEKQKRENPTLCRLPPFFSGRQTHFLRFRVSRA